MNSYHSNDYSYLDQIRVNEGADKCRVAFNNLLKKNTRRAIGLVNDRQLGFPCLYILHEQIIQPRIQRYLGSRNIIATRIVNQIRGSGVPASDYLSSRRDEVYSVLRWILETGSAEEIPEDDYEQIIDTTVSVLINVYRDMEITPLVVNLIFKRNRNGRFIHDLTWALFNFHDPQVLKLIANGIRSSDTKDTELAAALLNIDETGLTADNGDGEKRYVAYLQWLQENQPYMYFTQESFQYTSKPVFTTVDMERKYLQKAIPSYEKQPISPSDDEEKESLAAFRQLNFEEQRALSGYSQELHNKSLEEWKKWVRASTRDQIRIAKDRREGDE